MKAELEFWFEFGSTYSYLSALRIEKVCSERNIKIVWRPFLLGPLFKARGWNTSPFALFPDKGEYMWRDMERESQKYGFRFRKPDVFPQNGLLPARIATAAENEDWLPNFVKQVFKTEFESNKDISDPEIIKTILSELNLDADVWMEKAKDQEVKALLRERTEAASAQKIFGAPSFKVRKELFWGNDRLEEACSYALSTPPQVVDSLNEFCDRWLKAWTGNTPELLLQFYAEDIFYSDPAHPTGITGLKNLESYLKKLLKKYPDWVWTRQTLIPTHEGFSLIWNAKIPTSGKLFEVKGMDRIVLRDDRILRNEVYFNWPATS